MELMALFWSGGQVPHLKYNSENRRAWSMANACNLGHAKHIILHIPLCIEKTKYDVKYMKLSVPE